MPPSRDAAPAARGRADATGAPSPAGPPIVFVHGVRTSSAIWAHQMAAMARSGHRSVAVDLPGHGARAHERFTLRGAMDAIGQAVDALPVPPLIVGLSLGGYSTLAYAARHQDKVAGVLVAGCSTEIRGKPVRAYRSVAHHVSRTLRPTGGTWHVVSDMLEAMGGHSSLADLRRLLVPVWIVNGRRDVLRLEERRYLAARPGTRLTVVPRAGHDVNSHAPIVFNRILLDVLSELRTAGATRSPRREEASGARGRGPLASVTPWRAPGLRRSSSTSVDAPSASRARTGSSSPRSA
ncbi:alpha/beta fold hydrolase [uncultured Cellulomonas sp.]|uniref:alpha/beta fold hydrolase n=1 Tax=uncultured Cellulomonas sp. TaxID=189682 RepID=UPI00260A9844|nr:alpha/beta fold hydrolase [uncultured Cellulomonas sp.]